MYMEYGISTDFIWAKTADNLSMQNSIHKKSRK